jgi:hypothetical protein
MKLWSYDLGNAERPAALSVSPRVGSPGRKPENDSSLNRGSEPFVSAGSCEGKLSSALARQYSGGQECRIQTAQGGDGYNVADRPDRGRRWNLDGR